MKTLQFLLLFISAMAFSQNDMKARIEYEDAETAFAAGDFIKTISHLDEAKKMLKKENSKILYLQILAERELAKKDTLYFSQIKKSIEKIEKLPDFKSFPEEKKMDLYRLGKDVIEENKSLLQNIINKKQQDENFEKYTFGLPINISIDDLKGSEQLVNFYSKKTKRSNKTSDYYSYLLYEETTSNPSSILETIFFDANKIVKGYKALIDSSKKNDELSIIYASKIKQFTDNFGFSPAVHNNTYVWEKENKKVVIDTYFVLKNEKQSIYLSGCTLYILTK